jgi:hypothetical protein
VLSPLGAWQRILTSSIADELIIYRDHRSEDSDDTLHTEPAPRTLDSRQLGDDAFNLETLPTLSDHPANERDSNHGISNGESAVTGKRQRPVSPCSTVCHASASPLPQSKDVKSGRENIDSSDPDELGENDVRSKRRRLSALLSSKPALNRYKK